MADVKTWDYITSEELFFEALDQIKSYCKKLEKPILAIDFETFSKTGHFPKPYKISEDEYAGYPRLLQIGLDPKINNKQFIFDLVLNPKISELVKIHLIPILEQVNLLGHNLKYEYQFLKVFFGFKLKRKKRLLCLYLMSKELFIGNNLQDHGLKDLYQFIPAGLFKVETGLFQSEYDEFKSKYQEFWWGTLNLPDDGLIYASHDVKMPFFVFTKLKEILDVEAAKDKRPLQENIQLEWDCIPVIAEMELLGMPADGEELKKVIKELQEQLLVEEAEIAKYLWEEVDDYEIVQVPIKSKSSKNYGQMKNQKRVIGRKRQCINVNSHVKLKLALEGLGLNLVPVKSKYGAGREDLIFVVNDHPVVFHIIEYKRIAKLLSTYGESLFEFIHPYDSRIRPDIYQIGTETGRLAQTKPNLMQQPPAVKGIYKTKKGRSLIVADVSNGEVRILGDIAGEPNIIIPFEKGHDIHAYTGKLMFDLDYVPEKNSTYRKIGKDLRLSLQYLMGDKKLRNDIYIKTKGEINWTPEKAVEMKKKFFSTYPKMTERNEKIKAAIEKIKSAHESLADFKSYIGDNGNRVRRPLFKAFTTGHRRKTWFLTGEQERMAKDPDQAKELHKNFQVQQEDGRWGTFGNEWNSYWHSIYREAVNYPIQGTLADIMKMWMVELYWALDEINLDPSEGIINQVHDELIIEVFDANVEKVKELLSYWMTTVWDKMCKRIKVQLDIGVARSWKEAK